MRKFFQKIKVLEFATVLAGPSVGAFFAEMGAEVVKVEPPFGDVTRQWRLPGEEGDINAYYASVNWGKHNIVLNLKEEQDRSIAHRLVARADIVLVNFRPGDAPRLEMDYETLSQLNPALIYGEITGYGEKSVRPGYDALIQAESGLMFLNGPAGQGATKMPVALMDILAGHHLKEGLLVALLERGESGKGQRVSVSLMASALCSLANQGSNWLVAGKDPRPMGSQHPNIAPYGCLYGCADGKPVLLAVGSDKQFENLCTVLDMPQLPEDARFKTNAQRVQFREALDRILSEAIALRTREVLLAALAKQGVPSAALYSISEALEQELAQPLLLEAEAGLKGLRSSALWAEEPMTLRAPQTLGADQEHILQRWL